jgi:TolA-binding protein
MTRTRPPTGRSIRPACLALVLLAVGSLRAADGVSAVTGGTAGEPAPATAAPAPAISGGRAAEIHGLLNLGASLTERGDYEGAEIAYRQVLDDSAAAPTDTKSALLGLAHMHRRQGALTKAAAIYEKFLKEYPGDDRSPDALLELGRTLRSMGAYKTAIARFYSVINSTLKLPAEGFTHYERLAKTAQFEIAETHFQAGEFEEAGKFFSRLSLLDLVPADQAHAHFMAAYALHLQGDKEGAVAMLRAYLEQWPDDENTPEARYLLATNLRALNRTQEAFAATLELLRAEKSRVAANPKRWAYWQRRTGNQLANDFFENGDILDAQAIYAGLAALSSDPAWQLPVTYQVALCYERLGAADRARESYKKIVDSVGAQPAPALQELAQLAAWRLAQLDWHDTINRQVTSLIDTSTGRPQAPAIAPKTPAS